ncbi:hypothetical protein TWF694_003771 [Orbilia ellipsospora]|uniref:Protein kinase domain-containing protein n=1 Tax=Orbilia ellipsospora TaxID=2528407 RepID=A0AAV9WZ49_9PEZI
MELAPSSDEFGGIDVLVGIPQSYKTSKILNLPLNPPGDIYESPSIISLIFHSLSLQNAKHNFLNDIFPHAEGGNCTVSRLYSPDLKEGSALKRFKDNYQLIFRRDGTCLSPRALQKHIREIYLMTNPFLSQQPNIMDCKFLKWEYNAQYSDDLVPYTPALVLTRAEGGTITHYQQRASSFMPQMLLEDISFCYDICLAIEALHACGVAHGDIKPGNVLIRYHFVPASIAERNQNMTLDYDEYGPYWRWKITTNDGSSMHYRPMPSAILNDFGDSILANETPLQRPFGTMAYWAPECDLPESLPLFTDIFSLGLTIWEIMMRKFYLHSNSWNQLSAVQLDDLKRSGRVLTTACDWASCIASLPTDRILDSQPFREDLSNLLLKIFKYTLSPSWKERSLGEVISALESFEPLVKFRAQCR